MTRKEIFPKHEIKYLIMKVINEFYGWEAALSVPFFAPLLSGVVGFNSKRKEFALQ